MICEKVATDHKELNIDHCHTTGRIRGVLCRMCNWGLGMFKDSKELMIKAAIYIEERE